MPFTRVIQTISITNTVQATFTTALNTALANIPAQNIVAINYAINGTAGATRYSALIIFYVYN